MTRADGIPPPPLRALHAGRQRAGLEKAKTLPADALIFDLEDAVAPDAKDAARENACAAAASGEYGRRELTIRVNGLGTAVARRRPRRRRARPGRTRRRAEGRTRPTRSRARRRDRGRRRADAHAALGHGRDAGRDAARRGDRRASDALAVLVMGTNDLAKELGAAVPGPGRRS